MEHKSHETLYQAARNIDGATLLSREDKSMICCCVSNKWWFKHSGIAGFTRYDENKNLNPI